MTNYEFRVASDDYIIAVRSTLKLGTRGSQLETLKGGKVMIKFETPEYNNPDKHYAEVKAIFDTEGNITPVSINFEEGEFEIDRIVDIRPAASLKSGGAGIRYTCYIEGKQTYLFLEDTKWFFEN